MTDEKPTRVKALNHIILGRIKMFQYVMKRPPTDIEQAEMYDTITDEEIDERALYLELEGKNPKHEGNTNEPSNV